MPIDLRTAKYKIQRNGKRCELWIKKSIRGMFGFYDKWILEDYFFDPNNALIELRERVNREKVFNEKMLNVGGLYTELGEKL